MVVQKFRQLLAQAFVALALMSEHDGAFEQDVLQILRQLAPQIGGGGAENQKIAGGNVVDGVIGLLIFGLLSHGLAGCKFRRSGCRPWAGCRHLCDVIPA